MGPRPRFGRTPSGSRGSDCADARQATDRQGRARSRPSLRSHRPVRTRGRTRHRALASASQAGPGFSPERDEPRWSVPGGERPDVRLRRRVGGHRPMSGATVTGKPAAKKRVRLVRLGAGDRVSHRLVPEGRHRVSSPSHRVTLLAARAAVHRRDDAVGAAFPQTHTDAQLGGRSLARSPARY